MYLKATGFCKSYDADVWLAPLSLYWVMALVTQDENKQSR